MTPENIAIFNKERPAKTYAAYVIGGDIGGTKTFFFL